jgi:hypothetical protein
MSSTTEKIHGAVWADEKTVAWYRERKTFLDAGEEQGFALIGDEARDQPILDIGVGAGRTVPLLTGLSTDYVGIDYSDQMVRIAQQQHPGIDLRQGDARDLSAFPDNHFQLVMFSHNGIDCVAHEDRLTVLREALRVLHGQGLRFRPWQVALSAQALVSPRKAWRAVKDVLRVPRRWRNYLAGRNLWRRGEGWCTGSISTHDFKLVMHYVTLEEALTELRQAGFAAEPVVLDSGFGRPVRPGQDTRDMFWFQILARKPA